MVYRNVLAGGLAALLSLGNPDTSYSQRTTHSFPVRRTLGDRHPWNWITQSIHSSICTPTKQTPFFRSTLSTTCSTSWRSTQDTQKPPIWNNQQITRNLRRPQITTLLTITYTFTNQTNLFKISSSYPITQSTTTLLVTPGIQRNTSWFNLRRHPETVFSPYSLREINGLSEPHSIFPPSHESSKHQRYQSTYGAHPYYKQVLWIRKETSRRPWLKIHTLWIHTANNQQQHQR